MKYNKYLMVLLLLLSACANVDVSAGQSANSALAESENSLMIQTTLKDVAKLTRSQLVFQFYKNAELTGDPEFKETIPVNLTGEEGDVEQVYTFLSLTEGEFYLRVFLDENSNDKLDKSEKSGKYLVDGELEKIKIKEDNKQIIVLTLN